MPVPVSDFCCIPYEKSHTDNINTENTLSMLLEACPESALAKHLKLKPQKRKILRQHTPEESPKR